MMNHFEIKHNIGGFYFSYRCTTIFEAIEVLDAASRNGAEPFMSKDEWIGKLVDCKRDPGDMFGFEFSNDIIVKLRDGEV